MVCYARPAGRFAVLLIGVLLVCGRPVSHFLDTAAFLIVALAVTAGAAIAAALVFAALMSAQRRRATAGGCVNCQFRCQHAMTGRPGQSWRAGRLWLVTRAARPGPPESGPAQARLAPPSARPGAVPLPMPSVRSADLAAAGVLEGAGSTPRWPDRPLHRAPGQHERAGSPT